MRSDDLSLFRPVRRDAAVSSRHGQHAGSPTASATPSAEPRVPLRSTHLVGRGAVELHHERPESPQFAASVPEIFESESRSPRGLRLIGRPPLPF